MTGHRPRAASRPVHAAALIVAFALNACGAAPLPDAPRPGRQAPDVPAPERRTPPQRRTLRRQDLTPAELKYGRAPGRDPSITYEPGVILVDGGADAIKSLSPDGLTWAIDARAPHADELAVGRIAFVTGYCVGRVLDLKRADDTLSMVLGPVDLTDVFRDVDLSVDEPIDVGEAQQYPVPRYADSPFPVEGDAAGLPDWSVDLPRVAPASWDRPDSATRPLFVTPVALRTPYPQGVPGSPGVLPVPPKLSFHTEPLQTADGIGAELRHDGSNGLRVVAQVQVRLAKPTLVVHLSIHHRNVEAMLLLKNAAGLRVAFDAAGNERFSGSVNWYAPAPGVITIPLSGPGGFHVDIRQDIWVRTEFRSRQSVFSALGDYGLNADIGLTIWQGRFSVIGPKGFTVRRSLMSNMSGVALGPTGIVISHQATATAGIGFAQFTVGPSIALATSVAVAQGPSNGIVQCRGAALAMKVKGGVGWTIPRPVAQVVNFFLTLVRAKPIADHGGVYTDYQTVFEQQAHTPSPVCGGSDAQPTETGLFPAPAAAAAGHRGALP